MALLGLAVASIDDNTRGVEEFLALELVRRETRDLELAVADEVIASAVAGLSIRKHVLLNAGTARARTELARALARAGASAKRSVGFLEAHMATAVPGDTDAQRTLVSSWGGATLDEAADASCWLVLFDIDLWNFSDSGMARSLAQRQRHDIGSWRVIATSAGLARRPLDAGWRKVARHFAWIDLSPDAA